FARSELGAAPPAGELTAAVRPEKIRIEPEGRFAASVIGCEYLGDQYVVTLKFGETVLTVAGVTREMRAGEPARFAIAPRDLLFFDRASGRRVG
ncbi:MAG TPA: TOBE domain-containing protein, partial [candidate division Zixibacteria bacterium]|nr:TOBE domain-containing protein [candidate division Zixibacteria bacterium]